MHAASSLLEMFSSDEHLSIPMEVSPSSVIGSGSVLSKGALRQVAFNEAYDCLGMQSESLLKKGILTALTLQRVRTYTVMVNYFSTDTHEVNSSQRSSVE